VDTLRETLPRHGLPWHLPRIPKKDVVQYIVFLKNLNSPTMQNINVLAKNVVKSFNFLLRDESLAPDDGLALAEVMTLLATHYKNREKTGSGQMTDAEQDEARGTETRLRALLQSLEIEANLG
jgi:hypothetical protein